jgi:lysophospholipase L1-like esterase
MAGAMLAAGIFLGVTVDRAAASHGGVVVATDIVLHKVGISVNLDENLADLVGPHWETRDRMVQLQAAEVPSGGILLLGDSTIEGFWWNKLRVGDRDCVALNAGFAGAGVEQVRARADHILAEARPSLVILSVGINDAWPDADVARWGRQYDELLGALVARKVAVVAVAIMPPEPGFPNVTKSAATVERYNAAIRAAAQRHGVLVVDQAAARSSMHGTAHFTADGIHPTGPFYRALESKMLVPVIEAVEKARHLQCATAA